jgi:hypothetical protein
MPSLCNRREFSSVKVNKSRSLNLILIVFGNRQQPLRLTVPPGTLLAPVGEDGKIKRNSFCAGGVFTLDLFISKQLTLFKPQTLTVRADIFNLTSRTNFGVPNRLLEAPGFGEATSTITSGRRVQLALKYSF